MTTATVTLLIVISTITNVLSVFVFGLFVFGLFVFGLFVFGLFVFGLFVSVFHSLEILGELVAFCATVEEAIITELGVTQLGTIWRSCS